MNVHDSDVDSTPAHIDALTLERDLAGAKVRHEMYSAVIIGGLLLLALAALALFTVTGRNRDAEEARLQSVSNGEQIAELSEQLDAAKDLIASTQRAELENLECSDRFINAQRETNLEAFAAQAEIVATLIPAEPPLPDELRRAELRRLRTVQQERIAEYRDVIAQSKAWGDAGRPLPCPLVEP